MGKCTKCGSEKRSCLKCGNTWCSECEDMLHGEECTFCGSKDTEKTDVYGWY